jgi:hypothetical protein
MDIFNKALGALLGWYFRLFGWAHPIVGLAVLSVLAGIAMLWLFARVSNQAAVTATKRRVYAHLLELRLFVDEPAMMWRAQGQLMTANLRYLGLMLVPALVIAVPMVVLLVRMEAYYGRAPLPVGSDAIVTLETLDAVDPNSPAPRMEAPAGIAVETPAVRVARDRQISWRIRALGPVSGQLKFELPQGVVEKRIEAGGGFRFVPGRRTHSVISALWYPDEPRLASPVAWIDVEYPSAEIEFLGLRWHWLVWFTIISMVAALAFKKRFGVVL